MKKKIFQEVMLHVLETSVTGNALFPNHVVRWVLAT